MFITPMKAAAIERLPHDADRWVLQPKLDGWRVIAGVSDRGTAWIESSTGRRLHTVPYITQALELAFPPNTVLDGEILDEYATRERSWNRTQTILSRDAVHKPTADDPPLTFAVFDVVISVERDLMADRFDSRMLELVQLFQDAYARYPNTVRLPGEEGRWAPVRMLELFPCKQEELDRLLALGHEGVVVKDVGSRYVQGGRSGEWRKLKPDQEIEGVMTGTYEPTAGSKYDGSHVGGITFRIEHADGRSYDGRCAGMTDALRKDLHDNPGDYVGRVVEITHKGVTGDGALRHPQLRRFRDRSDKAQASVQRGIAEHATPTNVEVDGTVVATTRKIEAKPATRKPPAKRKATPKSQIVEHGSGTRGKRTMRNYKAMKDKLHGVYLELLAGPGHEAYDRCVHRGSGDPRADIAECERLLRERGIL